MKPERVAVKFQAHIPESYSTAKETKFLERFRPIMPLVAITRIRVDQRSPHVHAMFSGNRVVVQPGKEANTLEMIDTTRGAVVGRMVKSREKPGKWRIVGYGGNVSTGTLDNETIFVRAGTKKEEGSATAKQRGYNTFPDKEGWEKVFKPYGDRGQGYYYRRMGGVSGASAATVASAPLKRISLADARKKKLFGPVYHGSTQEKQKLIEKEGFKVFVNAAHTEETEHGFPESMEYAGVPPPVHFLGFGIYFTERMASAIRYNGGTKKGIKTFYLDVPRLEEINFGSPRKMAEWWTSWGYKPPEKGEILYQDKLLYSAIKMTDNLKKKLDAVLFKGESFRGNLLDGNQIVVFDPGRIYMLDESLSGGLEVGAWVQDTISGKVGEIMEIREVSPTFEKDAFYYEIKWKKGGKQYNIRKHGGKWTVEELIYSDKIRNKMPPNTEFTTYEDGRTYGKYELNIVPFDPKAKKSRGSKKQIKLPGRREATNPFYIYHYTDEKNVSLVMSEGLKGTVPGEGEHGRPSEIESAISEAEDLIGHGTCVFFYNDPSQLRGDSYVIVDVRKIDEGNIKYAEQSYWESLVSSISDGEADDVIDELVNEYEGSTREYPSGEDASPRRIPKPNPEIQIWVEGDVPKEAIVGWETPKRSLSILARVKGWLSKDPGISKFITRQQPNRYIEETADPANMTEEEFKYRWNQSARTEMGIPVLKLSLEDRKHWVGVTNEDTLRIYRGSMVMRKLEPGDYVTTSRKYAKQYGNKILTKDIPIRYLRYIRGSIYGDPMDYMDNPPPELVFAPIKTIFHKRYRLSDWEREI